MNKSTASVAVDIETTMDNSTKSETQEPKTVNIEYALKYFVNYKGNPDCIDVEHTYHQPCYKKYYNGFTIPAKYLFTVPTPVFISKTIESEERVDVETVDHEPSLFFDSTKMNEQLDKATYPSFEDDWVEKIDKKEWKLYNFNMFKGAVKYLEADYFARLVYKGLRDEAVKRHLLNNKSAKRFKLLYGSCSWEPSLCQWLHKLILEKFPALLVKIYTDIFHVLETKVPPQFLDHMIISTSYMSVRSRLSGMVENQNSTQKKRTDFFGQALNQHRPEKIFGNPLLVMLPINCGKPLEPNTRPHRLMTDLSLLGTLVTVTPPNNSNPVEISVLVEQIINATHLKIKEEQVGNAERSVVLIGFGASALIACHYARVTKHKISAVICIGFSVFSMEGKIAKTNDRLLNSKVPLLFVIGQNATTSTVEEIEEFRSKLRAKNGLIVVGGADEYLRVNNDLKMKCSMTQSIADRCIINEISEFLNDVLNPQNILIWYLSSGDSSENIENVENLKKKLSHLPQPVTERFLLKIYDETKNNPSSPSPMVKEIMSTMAHLQTEKQSDHSSMSSPSTVGQNSKPKNNGVTTIIVPQDLGNVRLHSIDEPDSTMKVVSSKEPAKFSLPTMSMDRSNYGRQSAISQCQLNKQKRKAGHDYYNGNINNNGVISSIKKARGGTSTKRTYTKRNPNRPHGNSKIMRQLNAVMRGGGSGLNLNSTSSKGNSGFHTKAVTSTNKARIEDDDFFMRTIDTQVSYNNELISFEQPPSMEDISNMPIIFAMDNDDENIINDVSLNSCQL